MRESYQPWTDAEWAVVVEDRRRGIPVPVTAKKLGRSVKSLHGRINARINELPRWGEGVERPTYHVRAVQDPGAVFTPTPELTTPGLEALRPIVLDGPPPKPRAVSANAGVTVVAGDFHFPCQDDAAVSILLETVRELRPARIILNGDLPDLLAVSRYPKDARKQHNWSLQDEATAMHTVLRELEKVAPKDCELLETDANHSGNGTGSRWWRYLSDRIPHLLQMEGADAKLSYQAWWYPTWTRLQLVDAVILADGLLVTHGEMARKWAAYSARAHAEKYQHSVLHSHTHRMGSALQRVPAIGGRAESVVRAYEIGCMCTLEPGYTSAPNWSQGFAIVCEDGQDYGVELVNITAGRATVCALGKTVKAA